MRLGGEVEAVRPHPSPCLRGQNVCFRRSGNHVLKLAAPSRNEPAEEPIGPVTQLSADGRVKTSALNFSAAGGPRTQYCKSLSGVPLSGEARRLGSSTRRVRLSGPRCGRLRASEIFDLLRKIRLYAAKPLGRDKVPHRAHCPLKPAVLLLALSGGELACLRCLGRRGGVAGTGHFLPQLQCHLACPDPPSAPAHVVRSLRCHDVPRSGHHFLTLRGWSRLK